MCRDLELYERDFLFNIVLWEIYASIIRDLHFRENFGHRSEGDIPARRLKEIDTTIWECPRCGCIFGTLSLGESYLYVLPWMVTEEVPDARIRPYDFRGGDAFRDPR